MVETPKYKQKTKNCFFPNQEEPVYDPLDVISKYQFGEYWRREKDRINNGFYLADGKVFISGWLYWHCVYWKIKKKKTVGARTFPVVEAPDLRDIDWEAAINFEKALDQGKFIELVGSRGFGKTVWQSSYAGRIYTMVKNSQVVISAGNSKDNKTVTDMIATGLNSIHPIWKKKQLKSNWKEEIQAGFKAPNGEVSDKSSLSQIIIRNYENGNKTMAANGTRPDFHVIDEIGKIPNFIKCVKDSDGCWWANDTIEEGMEGKPTCLPMFTGTGGDMEVGADAAEMFFTPAGYNILEFEDIWEGRGKIGWFMPVTKARNEYKEDKTLAEYLGIAHSDLQSITIRVSNEQRCLDEWWTPKEAEARKSGNSTTLLSFKAYWPVKPSDSFIVLSGNDYNVEAAKAQQDKLKAKGMIGTPVELYHDGEKICHKFSDKLPITQWPVKEQSKDAPIVIYEFPIDNPPFGLYTAGVDSYRQGEADYSESLGSVYIYKRMHEINGEAYDEVFVASFAARPVNKKQWEEQARLLIKYYNAQALCENDDYSFIEYMINKGDGHYCADQPEWIKEIIPNTTLRREKGISRQSAKIISFLNGTLKDYLDSPFILEKDEKGSTTKEVTGVVKIPDIMLLEEVIKFNKKGNFDRQVASSLAIAQANKMDPIFKKLTAMEAPSRLTQYMDKKKARSPLFNSTSGLFKATKLFK